MFADNTGPREMPASYVKEIRKDKSHNKDEKGLQTCAHQSTQDHTAENIIRK